MDHTKDYVRIWEVYEKVGDTIFVYVSLDGENFTLHRLRDYEELANGEA